MLNSFMKIFMLLTFTADIQETPIKVVNEKNKIHERQKYYKNFNDYITFHLFGTCSKDLKKQILISTCQIWKRNQSETQVDFVNILP